MSIFLVLEMTHVKEVWFTRPLEFFGMWILQCGLDSSWKSKWETETWVDIIQVLEK